MFTTPDNTFKDLREKSVEQWLEDMGNHQDMVVHGGVKVTREYIEGLKKQIEFLEEKCQMKDQYLKKLKQKNGSNSTL